MTYFVPMVIEHTANGERAMDIKSRLLQDRIILLDSVVDELLASLIISQLLYLESQNPDADISLFINSPGGIVTDGLAILDVMNFIKPDISTTVFGQAASMGSLLASSGTKGKRFMLPNARHMIHQPLGGARGQATDMEIQVKEILKLKQSLINIYIKNTGHTYEKLEHDMDRDNYMGAEDSVAYGLADKLLYSRCL